MATATSTPTVSPIANIAPAIALSEVRREVSPGEIINLTAYAGDVDGQISNLVWQQSRGSQVAYSQQDGRLALEVPNTVLNQTLEFSVTATDNQGGESTKTVSLKVLANPSEIFNLIKGRTDGKGVDLVITGDGFTAAQQNDITKLATAYADYLRTQPDAGAHHEFWNFIAVDAVSKQSGADNGSMGGSRDTLFDATYNCNGMDRLLCVASGRVTQYLTTHAPQVDQKLVVVNDTKYGGAGYTSANLGTYSRASSALPLALHEMAHSFADLSDEYDYGNCRTYSEPNAVNATTNSNRNTVKWHHWLDDPSIDLYEGGRYCTTGVWRPSRASFMRVLGANFDAVNAEQWAISTYMVAGTHYAKYPETPVVEPGAQTFSVSTFADSSVQQVSWYVNGVATEANSDSDGRALTRLVVPGARVEAKIKDVTGKIRRDTAGYSTDTIVWEVR
ncbi:M64 family metallopeptidase [Salinibius halmophilus]|uniref:M64 family metallopeptidase n=1 Tax=Salinibius halmophilus TaxID=1853216 RepID=UPI001313DDAE|nr:M64 family metallopeptidase [Salinibius halmophilus]